MKVQLKLIPTSEDGKFIQPPRNFSPQVTVDLAAMGKTFGYEIEVMERSIPQIFSEMFAVNVIEITGPDGQVKIWDKASKRKAGQPTNEKSPTPN